jgi:simple sugar transport system ATP-binding protein
VIGAVCLEGINKRFGLTQALSNASLDVEPQTIHALVGENGAGKTTLVRVLYGALQPDKGTIRVDGNLVRFKNSAAAIQAGIGMVSQHYSIIPQLTCLENLILGAEPGWVLSMRQAKRRAEQLAKQMDFTFDWNRSAAHLSPSGSQKLEILKLLWRNARVMILDEPTAMLSPADSDQLFAGLKKLVARGSTVILVTHRIPEVIQHCDKVTVLRAGKNVASTPINDTDSPQLAQWIIGDSVLESSPVDHLASSEPKLVISQLEVKGRLANLSLQVNAGELVGVAGVDGNGQRELIESLLGYTRARSGKIVFSGKDITRLSVKKRLALGVRLIAENRQEEGMIGNWSLTENVMLGLQRLYPLAHRGWIDQQSGKRLALDITRRMDIKNTAPRSPIDSLSGGNQQRLVVGRALSLDPQLILGFQPARGLDIAATHNLYRAFREECSRGACAIVVSFDLDELIEKCDRIVVMRAGTLYELPEGQGKNRAKIGSLMVGAS